MYKQIILSMLILACTCAAHADPVVIGTGDYAILLDIELTSNATAEAEAKLFYFPLVVREQMLLQDEDEAISSEHVYAIGSAAMRWDDIFNGTMTLVSSASLGLTTYRDAVALNATPYGTETYQMTDNLTIVPLYMVSVGQLNPAGTMMYAERWSNMPAEEESWLSERYFVKYPVDNNTVCEVYSAYGVNTSMDQATFQGFLSHLDILSLKETGPGASVTLPSSED